MAVVSIQVTLGAAATQISTQPISCKQIIFQNNAAAVMRLGDSSVSATKGNQLASGSPGGSLVIGPMPPQLSNLNEWYAFGTATQVLDVTYVT